MAQCASRADLNLCRRGRLGHRSDRDLPEPRTLVRQSRQAIVQPAELGLRSGLDDIVSADGVLGLADSAPAGWLNAPNGTDLILAHREVVWVILSQFRSTVCFCYGCGHVGNALALSKRSVMSTAVAGDNTEDS